MADLSATESISKPSRHDLQQEIDQLKMELSLKRREVVLLQENLNSKVCCA